MKRLNLLPLFLIITLLLSSLPIHYVQADPTVIMNFLQWDANAFTNEVNQADITGAPPTQIANMFYRPGSDTIGMINVHGFNGSDYGFHYRFFFAIDYNDYAWLAAPQNTSIFNPVSGTGIYTLAYNTSATHVSNNVFLMGMKGASASTTTQFDSTNAVGSHATLGISDGAAGCFEFTTLAGDIFHEFLIQAKNDTTTHNAFELFVDGNYWCTFRITSPNDMDRAVLGHTQDPLSGSGTGNLRARYREYLVTGGRSIESLNLAGLGGEGGGGGEDPINPPPPAFGEGNQTTFSILTTEDDRGNLRSQYAEGETIIFDASLQFVNDTSGLVQDVTAGQIINFFRFDEFFNDWTFIGESPLVNIAGRGTRARLPYVHIDGLVFTTDFRANYTGNFILNLTATISNIQRIITIEDAQIPLSIGTRLSPPIIEGTRTGTIQDPLVASNILPQNIFSHDEPFRVSSFLTRIDTGTTLSDQTVFLQMDINATSNWVHFQTLVTNGVGRATSEFRIWDSRFVGEQRFRFVYFARAPFVNSTSVNGTAFVASVSADFRLTIEIIPSSIREGQRAEIRGQLINIANDQFGTPMPNERINLFISSFDKTAFFNLQEASSFQLNIRTDSNGLYSHIIFGPNIGGASFQTMDFFANSSINSVVATSANATLTITSETIAPPQEIGEVQPTNFLLFSFLIDNPKANCAFPDGKTCSTMLWMLIVFIVSSLFSLIAVMLKIPPALTGIGWLFMMLGGLIMGVAVQAVLEILLFIGALPVIVVLFISMKSILSTRAGGAGGAVDTA